MDPRFTQPVSREQIVAIIRQRAERNLDQVHTSHRGELVEEVGAPAHSTSLHWLAGAPGQIRMSTVELAGGLGDTVAQQKFRSIPKRNLNFEVNKT